MRADARLDRDDQRGARRSLFEADAGRHDGTKVAALLQPLSHDAGRVAGPSRGRRRAEAGDYGAPQFTRIDAGGSHRAGKLDVRDHVSQRQLVPQRHTIADQRCVNRDVVEPAKAEQMRDALAHVHHREGLPGPRLDDGQQLRIRRVDPFELQADRRDNLADVVGDVGRRGGRSQRDGGDDQHRPDAHASERVPHADFDRVGLSPRCARESTRADRSRRTRAG